jgi:DNA-binding NarL/FixJ family response regulator
MQAQISEHENTPIRVLIVDDHVILRQGISIMLNRESDFEVVGEAASERAALALTAELNPDIVLLDSYLGTTCGLDIAKKLLRLCPNTHIVLFAGPDDEKLLFDAIRIGVHGYLQKTLSIDDLYKALSAVQCGERVLGDSQAITQVVIEFNRLANEQNRLYHGLSTAEIELMRFVSNGCTNKEIGKRLFWSEITVKRKMQDVYRKLKVTDRAHAVAVAIRAGLI